MVLLFNPQYFTFGHYKQYFVHQLYISSKESCSRRHVYYPVSDTWRVSPPSHVSRLWDCCLLLVISVDTNFVFYRNWISFKNNKNCKILTQVFYFYSLILDVIWISNALQKCFVTNLLHCWTNVPHNLLHIQPFMILARYFLVPVAGLWWDYEKWLIQWLTNSRNLTRLNTFSASSAMSVFSQMMSPSFRVLISFKQCGSMGWMPGPEVWR